MQGSLRGGILPLSGGSGGAMRAGRVSRPEKRIKTGRPQIRVLLAPVTSD
jgi:hypothetical protein